MGDSFVEVGGKPIKKETSSRVRGFDALMAWLSTFTRMEGKSHDCNDVAAVLNDEAFAT
jgi:hypothetical protein